MNSATRAAIKMIEEAKAKDGQSLADGLRQAWKLDRGKGKSMAELLRAGMTMKASPGVLILGCPITATALVHFLDMVEWELVASAVAGGIENN
jgi:hypothetical protein